MNTDEIVQKLRSQPTVSVPFAADAFGVGRSTAYAAASEWPVIKVGSRLRVPSVWVLEQLGFTREVRS